MKIVKSIGRNMIRGMLSIEAVFLGENTESIVADAFCLLTIHYRYVPCYVLTWLESMS